MGFELKVDKKFAPHKNLKRVYCIYLGLGAAIPLAVTLGIFFVALTFATAMWEVIVAAVPLLVLLIIMGFVGYWIPRYYRSITYTLRENEVMVERGVWWKMKHVVPYARVMSVDIIQGPISRRFGLGSVQIHTAGYTGPRGGAAGPGSRGAEAVIAGVPNFVEIRNTIIGLVSGRPLFGGKFGASDVGSEMLKELKKIRKAVEK